MDIKIDFRNFWKVDYEMDLTVKFIKHFFEINNATIKIDNQNPDIIFYSVNCWVGGKHCFPESDITTSKGIKILFTRENLYAHWYPQTYLPNLDKFDFVLGFEDNYEKNHYKIPYYFVIGKLYDEHSLGYQIIQKNLVENLYKKNKNISLVSRNPHKLRLDIINKFKNKNVIVDCPGKVGKNMDDFDNKKLDHGEMDHNSEKINFLSNYFFNICPENSWSTGYTTEKLYHSIVSGCVPIYWGCDKLDDGFYNKEKIFLINKDLSNIDTIVDETVRLLNHPNELLHYVGMNPFGENRLDIISDQNKKINQIFKKIISSL